MLKQSLLGQPWENVLWVLCEESNAPNFNRDKGVSVTRDNIRFYWRYAWGECVCWCERGTCSKCGKDFCEYVESNPSSPLQTRFPPVVTVCRDCLEARSRLNSRVTSKRYREARKVLPMPKQCKQCGKSFQPKRTTAQFCSSICRVHHHRKK